MVSGWDIPNGIRLQYRDNSYRKRNFRIEQKESKRPYPSNDLSWRQTHSWDEWMTTHTQFLFVSGRFMMPLLNRFMHCLFKGQILTPFVVSQTPITKCPQIAWLQDHRWLSVEIEKPIECPSMINVMIGQVSSLLYSSHMFLFLSRLF